MRPNDLLCLISFAIFNQSFGKWVSPANIYLFKVTIDILEKGVKYVQSWTMKKPERRQWRFLVFWLLTLNIFHTFFKYFYCWLWTSNCKLGYLMCMFAIPFVINQWMKFWSIDSKFSECLVNILWISKSQQLWNILLKYVAHDRRSKHVRTYGRNIGGLHWFGEFFYSSFMCFSNIIFIISFFDLFKHFSLAFVQIRLILEAKYGDNPFESGREDFFRYHFV